MAENQQNRGRMNGPEQIAVLQQLGQHAAAWLCGVTARSLRDQSAIPRSRADGTYNARDLVAWLRSRDENEKVSDDDLERLKVAATLLLEGQLDGETIVAISELLRDQRAVYGYATLVAFTQLLVDGIVEQAEPLRRWMADPLRLEEKRRSEEFELLRKKTEAARQALHVAVVCDGCGRRRRGRVWGREGVPDSWEKMPGTCPSCEARGKLHN